MPSPLYTKVIDVASRYIDAQKAAEIMDRQMAKCGSTTNDFSRDHFAQIQKTLIGAIQLYVTDRDLSYKVADEIQALA